MIDKKEREEFENNFKDNLKYSVLNIFKENASKLLEANKFTSKELEFIGIRSIEDKEFNDYLESLICVMMDNFEDCLEEVEYEKNVTRKVREEYRAKGEIIKGYGEEELYEIIENHLKNVLIENDINTDIIDFQIIGSRNKDVFKEDSDLDVLFEYNNDNIGEDSLFNIFNDEDNKLYIDGIEVDFNPITEDKSGSIDEWLTRNYSYNKYNVKSEPKTITEEEFDRLFKKFELIENGGEDTFEDEEKDLFLLKEGDSYTAIDNLSGNLYTENFETRDLALRFLEGEDLDTLRAEECKYEVSIYETKEDYDNGEPFQLNVYSSIEKAKNDLEDTIKFNSFYSGNIVNQKTGDEIYAVTEFENKDTVDEEENEI